MPGIVVESNQGKAAKFIFCSSHSDQVASQIISSSKEESGEQRKYV